MKFRLGQRVRLLHESGEGRVTALVDQNHVEVDLGDDFPLEVHISEVIPIDHVEGKYFAEKEEEAEAEEKISDGALGVELMNFSMILLAIEEGYYEVILINPEPADILYSLYIKRRGKYQGVEAGQLKTGEKRQIAEMSREEIEQIKEWRFQILPFKAGKGFPQTAITFVLNWDRGRLMEKPRDLPFLRKEGWLYSLRKDALEEKMDTTPDRIIETVVATQNPVVRPKPEFDLHIEALVDNPQELAPSEMLRLQMRKVEEILADADRYHYAGVILIHGVGIGTLKSAIVALLKTHEQVKKYSPASPALYGNGATEVEFY